MICISTYQKINSFNIIIIDRNFYLLYLWNLWQIIYKISTDFSIITAYSLFVYSLFCVCFFILILPHHKVQIRLFYSFFVRNFFLIFCMLSLENSLHSLWALHALFNFRVDSRGNLWHLLPAIWEIMFLCSDTSFVCFVF